MGTRSCARIWSRNDRKNGASQRITTNVTLAQESETVHENYLGWLCDAKVTKATLCQSQTKTNVVVNHI